MNPKDGFWRITFDTNPNDCNLHCLMCEHHSLYSDVEKNRIASGIPRQLMDIELIKKVLSSTRGSAIREIIPSTMGEPLLYQDFPKIIELCREFGVKLNLTTNGTFPVKGAIQWAELIVPVASDVKISWNGATKKTQETIMQGSNFDRGLQNIKDFLQVRDRYRERNYCQVTLQLTFMELNLPELPDMVKLGISLGIDRIKGHHLWVNFKELEQLSLRRDSSSIARWNKTVQIISEIADDNLLPNGKKINLVNFDLLSDDAIYNLNPQGVCPFLGQEAWIAPDGSFKPCCAPDILRQELGDFGNINEVDVLDIWRSNAYQNLVKNYMQHRVCVACNMRRLPGESC